MASHFVSLARGVEGSKYNDFTTGTSATTDQFEFRVLDGVTPTKVEVLKALEAFERFLADHRVLVEPACGAALALAYEAGRLDGYQNVLVVVCGGATATLKQIQDGLKQIA
jgi:threonine dehydratase